MQILNKTPFRAGTSLMFDHTGENIIPVAVKVSFIIPKTNELPEPAKEQTEVFIADQPFDTPSNSNTRYPADTVLKKENTDIILNGTVYSPKPVKRVQALVRIGKYHKIIEAVGNRTWKKRLSTFGFKKTEPESFLKMPITCNCLYGGKGFAQNIHGTGFTEDEKIIDNMPLPNFELPKQKITSTKKQYTPATFGCTNPAADHRRQHAGTYDEDYLENQSPLFPEDINMKFFNVAQPELITDGFINSKEQVLLKNLSEKEINFTLPTYNFDITYRLGKKEITKQPDLYTILIEPDHDRFYMTWGLSISVGNQPSKLSYIKAELKGV